MNPDLQQYVNQHLVERLKIAYICVDKDMMVCDVSKNLKDYGYGDVTNGVNVEDYVEFMVGLDTSTALDLPFVTSPLGVPVSVSLLPEDGKLMIMIADASEHYEQRQQLQQKANENELLLAQQNKLMADLELASKELARNNKQLEEASRLQTSFFSGVSHEFRTPLASIIGYTELVSQKFDGDGQEKKHLRAIQRSSKHLLSLVENLLDHGKLDANEIFIQPKSILLNEVFDDVGIFLGPLANAKHISLKVQTDFPDHLMVTVDASRLRQCLINLVGNAIKFTDQGLVTLKAKWSNDLLEVVVQDTGMGISEDDLQKIRLPFWQAADTGKAGTGLGLTITERIISLLGGELEISSQIGKGTTVSFEFLAPLSISPETLPASKLSATAPISNTKEESQVSLAKDNTKKTGKDSKKYKGKKDCKVLLAEDDYDIAILVELMLEEKGVGVTHVENGDLAVKTLQDSEFDLVLMDINMPVMSGYEAIKVIREQGNLTPIIVMSASALDSDREKAMKCGSDGYLVKPVELSELIAMTREIVSKTSA